MHQQLIIALLFRRVCNPATWAAQHQQHRHGVSAAWHLSWWGLVGWVVTSFSERKFFPWSHMVSVDCCEEAPFCSFTGDNDSRVPKKLVVQHLSTRVPMSTARALLPILFDGWFFYSTWVTLHSEVAHYLQSSCNGAVLQDRYAYLGFFCGNQVRASLFLNCLCHLWYWVH